MAAKFVYPFFAPVFPLCLQTIQIGPESVGLYVPDAAAVRAAYEAGQIAFPYWSKVWPAAFALGEFLLANPSLVQGKTVVELGAGLGLPSLVAARFAARVLCTDAEPAAVRVAALSAVHHQLQNFSTAVVDWSQHDSTPCDVLLLSDVNYEPAGFASLRQTLEGYLDRGTMVLLSTPQRLMAKPFIEALLPFCVRNQNVTVKMGEDVTNHTVMVLQSRQ